MEPDRVARMHDTMTPRGRCGRLYGWLYRFGYCCVRLAGGLVIGMLQHLAGGHAALRERLEFARFLCRWKKPT